MLLVKNVLQFPLGFVVCFFFALFIELNQL